MRNASFKLMLYGCLVSVCCVGFASLLISVCMFIVSKTLFISSATVIVRTGGWGHLSDPLCYCVI